MEISYDPSMVRKVHQASFTKQAMYFYFVVCHVRLWYGIVEVVSVGICSEDASMVDARDVQYHTGVHGEGRFIKE